ncbi:MAG: hypothetical protein IT516_12375 [Burkholderiales bacterium]|nr:hypothetical protein [Burkholderiales bacterium]
MAASRRGARPLTAGDNFTLEHGVRGSAGSGGAWRTDIGASLPPGQVDTILEEAQDIVYGDREQTHGDPGRNLRAIAAMWSPVFGVTVTEQQVVMAMILLKVARAINMPAHRDHWRDIAGYVALAERAGHIATEGKS